MKYVTGTVLWHLSPKSFKGLFVFFTLCIVGVGIWPLLIETIMKESHMVIPMREKGFFILGFYLVIGILFGIIVTLKIVTVRLYEIVYCLVLIMLTIGNHRLFVFLEDGTGWIGAFVFASGMAIVPAFIVLIFHDIICWWILYWKKKRAVKKVRGLYVPSEKQLKIPD